MSLQVINTTELVAELADSIANLPVSPPSLYIDLKGINTSRQDSISIVTLFVLPSEAVYIVDIEKLGAAAFSTEGDAKQSFQATLESEAIPKVFFDVRNGSGVLRTNFQVNLAEVHDVQLMEFATRNGPRRRYYSLTRCIYRDFDLGPQPLLEWELCRSVGRALLESEVGNFEIFDERSLGKTIAAYCAQNVIFLPELWNAYDSKLTPGRRARVATKTRERLVLTVLSQSDLHLQHGRRGALSL